MMTSATAEPIVAKLCGSAADREEGYALCGELCQRGVGSAGAADAAALCVAPLCRIMMRDAAEVGAKEYQRAAIVLHGLFSLDPIRMAGEACRKGVDNQFSVWASGTLPPHRSAFGAVLLKPPSELTVDDTMVIISGNVPHGLLAPHGSFETMLANYSTWDAMAGEMMRTDFMLLGGPSESEERNLRLTSLMLWLLRPEQELPGTLLSATHSCLTHMVVGRPAVAAHFLEEDGLEILCENLQRTAPKQWVTTEGYAQPEHGGVAFWAVCELLGAMSAGRADITARLLSSGYIDVSPSPAKPSATAFRPFRPLLVTQNRCWDLYCVQALQCGAA